MFIHLGRDFSWDKISYRPGWPEAHHLADDVLLALLSPPPKLWGHLCGQPYLGNVIKPALHIHQAIILPTEQHPQALSFSDVLHILSHWVLFVVILRQFLDVNQIVYLREFRKLY